MIKTIFRSFAFACLFFCSLGVLYSQAWHPLPGNRLLLYSFEHSGASDEFYFAIHADSVRLEGADSAYYFYRISRRTMPSDTVPTCGGQALNVFTNALLIDQDHYWGRKMLARPQGEYLFVSSAADTFSLRAEAAALDSWAWTGSITATVDSIVAGTVLGSPDSLKYIRLSSGAQWILSRSHGLVQCTNLLPFAGYTAALLDLPFTIWGIPDLNLGNRLPTYGEIFQFDVNDKLGYQANTTSHPLNTSDFSNVVITSQTPGSRFQYQIQKERLHINDPYFGNNDTTYFGPAMQTVTYDSALHAPLIQLLPYQYVPGIPGFVGTPIQTGFQTWASRQNRMHIYCSLEVEFDTCANAYLSSGAFGRLTYTEGLGQTQYVWITPVTSESNVLNCYEKGTDLWDTCLVLNVPTAVAPASESEFQLFPNPASSQVRLQVQGHLANPRKTFRLLGIDGQLLGSDELPAGTTNLDWSLEGIPSGVYILELEAKGAPILRRRLVVAK